MPPPLATGVPPRTAPTFRVIDRPPPHPVAFLLAIVIAVGAVSAGAVGLRHNRAAHLAPDGTVATRTPGGSPSDPSHPDEKDDPSQVDTIVLGDAADAPVPARRDGHISDVHATILIRLPRFGEETGLIPNSPAGHLLYDWLAAFNQGSEGALERVLPNAAPTSAGAAQMVLRMQTGGFNLLSAKEVQPGVIVFRLRDQTPLAVEVLGTLQARPNSNPAAIATLSLRAIPASAHISPKQEKR